VDLASGMPYACSLEELTPGRDVVDLASRPGQVQDNCCVLVLRVPYSHGTDRVQYLC
jgi:hypothetical protein